MGAGTRTWEPQSYSHEELTCQQPEWSWRQTLLWSLQMTVQPTKA